MEAEIQHGAKKGKGEMEIVVSSETDSSSDEMNLKVGKTKKTEITKASTKSRAARKGHVSKKQVSIRMTLAKYSKYFT